MTPPRTPARPLDPDPRYVSPLPERTANPTFSHVDDAIRWLRGDYDTGRTFLQGFLAGLVIGLAAGVCGAVVFR